MMYITDIIE